MLAVRKLRSRGMSARLAPLTTEPYPGEVHRKVSWICARAGSDDVAIDVHLDVEKAGCAVYAVDRPRELALADMLAERVAEATGLRCRGGLPESETHVRRLAYLHSLPCLALVVELCSIGSSDLHFARRRGARDAFAEGLARGGADLCEAVAA
jgi:hypothetical protein